MKRGRLSFQIVAESSHVIATGLWPVPVAQAEPETSRSRVRFP